RRPVCRSRVSLLTCMIRSTRLALIRATLPVRSKRVRSKHIRLLYVPIPTALQIVPNQNPAVLDRVLQLFRFDKSVLNLEDQLTASFVSYFKVHEIECREVKESLKAKAKRDVLYDSTSHLTEPAHAVIGEDRSGPGYLNRISASIGGASAGVKLPSGKA